MSDTINLRYPGIHASASPEKPAIIMAGSGKSMTYAELDTFAWKMARLLQDLGLKPGDHVAFCVENRLECLALQWGAHYAGVYYTFISSRLLSQEVAYIVGDCSARVVVLSSATISLLPAIQGLAQPPRIYSLDAGGELATLSAATEPFAAEAIPGAVEGSDMLYSSGTTGRPKGIKPTLTGKPLGSTGVIADLMQRGFGVTSASVYLSTAPYYHAAPMKWCQGVTCLGGTIVMMEKFDAEATLQLIERHKVTHSQWVPTMFSRLLSLPPEVRNKYDLSSQRMAVHAAAPCPVPIKQAMIDWWGPIVAEYYSCTEGMGMTFTDTAAWLAHPGTVGRPLLGKLHIVGEDGKEVPVGEEGLVFFSAGPVFTYHNDPEKTREAYNLQGWATVGDIGKVDQEGFLYLTDRKSNMIISGGVNVYPQETENVLITHPKVFDVAVIGTPHEDFGEEVRAVVQLQPGEMPSSSLGEELIAFCRQQLSPIKCPRVVDFRNSLPREPNGKLLKRLLRDEYRAAYEAVDRLG